jgi:hypothetical protein
MHLPQRMHSGESGPAARIGQLDAHLPQPVQPASVRMWTMDMRLSGE